MGYNAYNDRATDICSYIRKFVNENSVYIRPYILSGRLNNEYIRGNQYQRINRDVTGIEDKKVPDSSIYMERKVFNRMLPIYLTRYGILTENMPIPGFKPTESSAKTVMDAVEGNKFIKNFLLDIGYDKKYGKLVRHTDIYGVGWIKTGLDWSMGDTICDIPIDIKDDDLFRRPEDTHKGVYELKEGRPFLDIIPIHEVFVDSLYVDDMEAVNELVHRRPFTLQYIKNRWGIDATPESITDRFLATYPQYSNIGFAISGLNQYAFVHEYYKRPDAVYPDGRYTMVVNTNIIYDGKLPYINGPNKTRTIPFDLVKMQSVPNYLMGPTVYQQILPIQDTFNAVKNRYLEYVNHIAIGQLYVWEGSLANKNAFTTKPGKMIALKRNSRQPTPVTKDKLSMEFMNYIRSLEDDMLVAAGISQLSAYGMSKSNVRTDGVADKIGESDQNKLALAIDNLSIAICSAFKKVLFLEQERQAFLTETLALAKHDDYVVKYNVKNINPSHITVVNRDFLMQSDQVMKDKMLQAQSMGLYNPQAGLSYVTKLEMLDALRSNNLIDTLDPTERATHDLIIEEHVDMMDKEKLPEAAEWHVHPQHILEHNLFRISPSVRHLKTEDEKMYELLMDKLDKHIKGHEKYGKNMQSNEVYKNAKSIF